LSLKRRRGIDLLGGEGVEALVVVHQVRVLLMEAQKEVASEDVELGGLVDVVVVAVAAVALDQSKKNKAYNEGGWL
jgi:hypothetical protein